MAESLPARVASRFTMVGIEAGNGLVFWPVRLDFEHPAGGTAVGLRDADRGLRFRAQPNDYNRQKRP